LIQINAETPRSRDLNPGDSIPGRVLMTSGEEAYLIMVVVAFVGFAAVLFWESFRS
jgi:hypothetical protein